MRFSALLGFLDLFENEIGTVSCLSRNQHLKSAYDCIKIRVSFIKMKTELESAFEQKCKGDSRSEYRIEARYSLELHRVMTQTTKRRQNHVRTKQKPAGRVTQPGNLLDSLALGNCHRHFVTLDCFMALVLFNSSVI